MDGLKDINRAGAHASIQTKYPLTTGDIAECFKPVADDIFSKLGNTGVLMFGERKRGKTSFATILA